MNRTRARRLVAPIVITSILAVGVAAAYQIFGVGMVFWGVQKSLAASGCITTTAGGSTCAAFPAGYATDHQATVTVISSDAAGVCCWSLDSGFTVTNAMAINSTQGGCFRIRAAGQTWHQRPSWAQTLAYSGSSISGLCATAVTHGFQTEHQPCDADGDCNSGTCTANASLTDAQKRSAGLYLICVPQTGTVVFDVSKDRVDL